MNERELKALLAFIGNKQMEIGQPLPFLFFPIKENAKGREYQPLEEDNCGEGVNQSVKPSEVIRYTNDLVLDHLEGTYKYIDISDYWERLLQRFETMTLYTGSAMPVHWFLLYYVHRFGILWQGRSIVVERPAVASIETIDTILSSFIYTHGDFGREQVKDIVDFAAKVVGNLDIIKITGLYIDDADAFDSKNRVAKLSSFLKALPKDDSIEFCEVLDSISFVLNYGGYWDAQELFWVYFHVAPPSYKCLDLKDEFFPKYSKALNTELPNVLLPFFNNVEELLDCIKKEYDDNRQYLDRDIQPIVDELLAQSRLEITAEGVPEKAVNSELNLEDFSLPEDLFDSKLYPVDQKNPDQHFSLNYDVKAAGVEKLCKLVNTLASIGYVSGNDRTLRLLTYVLTGKLKPEDYVEGEKVKWLDDGYGYELLYVIRYIIGNEKGKYKKAKKLFDCLWMRKNRTSKREYRPQDSAQCANVDFMRELHDIYPNVCPEKSKHVKSF